MRMAEIIGRCTATAGVIIIFVLILVLLCFATELGINERILWILWHSEFYLPAFFSLSSTFDDHFHVILISKQRMDLWSCALCGLDVLKDHHIDGVCTPFLQYHLQSYNQNKREIKKMSLRNDMANNFNEWSNIGNAPHSNNAIANIYDEHHLKCVSLYLCFYFSLALNWMSSVSAAWPTKKKKSEGTSEVKIEMELIRKRARTSLQRRRLRDRHANTNIT